MEAKELIFVITYDNGIFSIQTSAYSYLFRVNKYGLLEHLYFGAPVPASDAAAFACRPGLGWGASMLLNEKDLTSGPDSMSLEWSSSGRGDFRESPMALGGVSADPKYHSHEIFDGIVPMEQGLPQAQGDGQTLCITMTQPGLELKLYYTAFPTALTRRTVIRNTGDTPITVTKLMSFCLDLPGSYHMTTFDGGWIREMGKHTVPVTLNRVVNESTTGSSSNRHNPGFLLSQPDATEDHGRVYGLNLVYSGNHYGSAQQSIQNLTRVMQGISPDNFLWTLASGDSFETPEAVLAVSEEGFGGLSRCMHQFVNDHIVPKKWQYRARPILYNDWEGCMFHFNHDRLMGLARRAKKLGCELFVLDDGWFGNRNNDLAGLGDYNVNKKKLPYGLKGLAKAVNKLGMEFGLWFEPESVNPDSDLYRAHPDWALTDDFAPLLGRHQLLLDLTKAEVRDYIVENVSRTLDSANITYVKWDMNRHSIALGAKSHAFILGLYDVLRRIFEPRPNILLESCSSGGNRFDLGMLCFSPQVWCSDDTDPIERLTIQGNLSYLYPQSTFGAHVSAAPHAQTLRQTPLTTRGNVSFFGCLGYELDLKHLLPVEIQEIQAQIAFYKQYRKIFQFGHFRRIPDGWQVSQGNTTLAGIYSSLVHAAPGYQWLKLKNLNSKVGYHVTSRDQRLRIGPFGGLVSHLVPVSISPHGAIMRFADHHFTLPDGTEDITCSGAALMAGVPLAPRFMGTGYGKNARTQGDFGSNLYVIEPID